MCTCVMNSIHDINKCIVQICAKTHSIFSFGITGSFSYSDICGRNMCKHSSGLGISMDYAKKESEEALTQRCVGLSNWSNWNLLSLTVIILLYSYSKTWDQKLSLYTCRFDQSFIRYEVFLFFYDFLMMFDDCMFFRVRKTC